MYKVLYFLISFLMLLGCSNSQEKFTSITGAYTFQLVKEGEGEEVKDGEFIIANLTVVDANDSIWFERDVTTSPVVFKKDEVAWKEGRAGFNEIFNNVKVKDSITFTITPTDFFVKALQMDVPPGIDTTVALIFQCGIEKILSEMEFEAYRGEQMAKARQQEMADRQGQIEAEAVVIKAYLEENNLEAQQSESGVFYIIHQEGEGPRATSGQRVTANYSGYLLDGTCFDSSIETVAREKGVFMEGRDYAPFAFTIDQDRVIGGWHEGFKLLNKGAKATLYIPSALGYGDQGSPPVIPPSSPLIFEVELVNLE